MNLNELEFWEFRSHEGIVCAHDLHLEEIPWEHCYGENQGDRRAFIARDLPALRYGSFKGVGGHGLTLHGATELALSKDNSMARGALLIFQRNEDVKLNSFTKS